MRRRQSRRYRWLPMMLTAGGLALILLAGVVATPGRTPEPPSTTQVGLVADNTSAAVVPNANFQRGRADVVGMLDEAVTQLRSRDTPSTAAAADRLDVIGQRLEAASPSEPDELEAIVADLNQEARHKLAARPGDPVPNLGIQSARRPRPHPVTPPRRVIVLLGDIIAALRDLIRGLLPPIPYVYVPGSSAGSPVVSGNSRRGLPDHRSSDPSLDRSADFAPSRSARSAPSTMNR
jgi:hypothetical protein